MNLQPVVWIGASYDDLRAFPEDVQDDFGYALYLGQTGELSDKAKPMRGLLRDVVEIVASDPSGTYRLMYTVKLGESSTYCTHSRKSLSAAAKRPKPSSSSSNDVYELRESSMKTVMIEGQVVRTGGSNVFADLGLPNPEERLLKAQLMQAINAEIRRRALTQDQASELVGLKQPELSRIANGRGSGFSVDRLLGVLRHLGRDVEIVVSSASGPIGELRFRELTK